MIVSGVKEEDEYTMFSWTCTLPWFQRIFCVSSIVANVHPVGMNKDKCEFQI